MSTWNGRVATGTVTKLDCGCVHDERRWLQQCEPCLLGWYTRHASALQVHAAERDDSGFWCESCKHYYRGDNQCPRHGR